MPTDGDAVSKNGKTEPTKEEQTPAPTEGEKKQEEEKDTQADRDEDDSSNDSNGFDPTERCSFLARAMEMKKPKIHLNQTRMRKKRSLTNQKQMETH
jgi:hypothetical protein